MVPVLPRDPWAQVAEVIRLIRTGEAETRPELADATRLGRNIVTLRIEAAAELGLIQPSGDLRSRGGRAAEVWELAPGSGRIAVGTICFDHLRVTLADLTLRPLGSVTIRWPSTAQPEETCERLATAIDGLLAEHGGPLWGTGLGVLAPVDFVTGRSADPVAPAAHTPRWPREFDVRRWFVRRLGVPVWVDSLSNLMAEGIAAEQGAPRDVIAVRMEVGVGSGIVTGGRLHRGADWIAGETNHIVVQPGSTLPCVCGRLGCLDALAGSKSVEAEARRAIGQGRSTTLARLEPGQVTLAEIVAAAEAGDFTAAELVLRAAEAVGHVLATIVTWFNPRRVVVGGNALAESPLFFGAMSRTLHATALAASVEHLELRRGSPDRLEETAGAIAMVRDRLLSPTFLPVWAPLGCPAKVSNLMTRKEQI